MLKRISLYLFVAVLAVALAACGGNGDDAADDTDPMDFSQQDEAEVTIQPVGDQMQFEQTEFTVRAGQSVTITMDNIATSPAMVHNVLVANTNDDDVVSRVANAALDAGEDADYIPDDDAVLASTAQAGPGEVTEVTFTAPDEPGEYTYICTYPGHYTAMVGTMVVVE